MADQTISGLQIQIGLDSGKFEASGVRLEARAKKISEAFNQISGLKTDQKLQEVQKAVERLGGVAQLSAPQVERLRKELDSLAAAGAKIPKNLTLPKLDTGASSKGVEALKGAGLQALQGQASTLGPLGGVLSAVGPAGLAAAAGIAAVGAAAAGTVAVVSDLVLNLAKVSSTLADLSAKTDLTTDFLQEIGFAGKLVGVTMEDIGAASLKLSANIGQGDKIFEKLGLSLTTLQGLNADEQFLAVANAIKAIPDPAVQAAAAIEAFGKGGAALLPLIRSNMAGAAEEARRLGIVMGSDVVQAGDRLDDALTKVKVQLEGFKNAIAAQFVEGGQLEEVLKGVSEAIAGMVTILPQAISLFKTFADGLASSIPAGAALKAGLGLAVDQLREAGRFAGVRAPKQEEIDAIRSAPQTSLSTDIDLQFGTQIKAAAEETRKLAAERVKAAKDAEEAEKRFLKSVADGIKAQLDGLAKVRAAREASSLALESTLTGGASEANLQSAQLQAQIIDSLGVKSKDAEGNLRPVAEVLAEINTKLEDFSNTQPAEQIDNLVAQFDKLAKAGADVPQGLGAVSDQLNKLNFDRATKQMREAEAAMIEFMATLADAGQIPGFNGDAIRAAFGGIPPVIDEAKTKTIEWEGELQTLANLAQTLPGIFGQSFGAILSGVAGIGGAIDKLKGLGGGSGGFSIGNLFKDAGKFDIGKTLGSLGQIGTIAGAAIGIGKTIVGGIKKLFGGESEASKAAKTAGKVLGEKVSEEMGAEILARAKQTGKSVEAVAKEIKVERIEAQFEDLKAKASEAVSDIGSGLSGFGQIRGAAEAQGRIFGAQFAAVVQTEGFDKALEMFKATFASLPEEIKASVPADIQKLFAFGENEQFAAAVDGISAMAQGFKGTVGLIGISKELMADYGQVAQASFDQAKAGAIEAGATQEEAQKAALQATIPLLSQLKSASIQSGEALDPASAGLIAQAEAAGITIPVDPFIEIADVLRQMLDLQRQLAGLPPLAPKVDTSQVTAATTRLGEVGREGGQKFTDGVRDGAAGAGAALTQGLSGGDIGEGVVQRIRGQFDDMRQTAVSAGVESAAAFTAAFGQIGGSVEGATDGATASVDGLGVVGDATTSGLTSGFDNVAQKLGIVTAKAREAAAAINTVRVPGGADGSAAPPQFDTGGIVRANRRGSLAELHGLEAILPLDRQKDANRILKRAIQIRPRIFEDLVREITAERAIPIQSFATGGIFSGGGGGISSVSGAGGGGGISVTVGPFQFDISLDGGGGSGSSGTGLATDFIDGLEQEEPRIKAVFVRAVGQAMAELSQ